MERARIRTDRLPWFLGRALGQRGRSPRFRSGEDERGFLAHKSPLELRFDLVRLKVLRGADEGYLLFYGSSNYWFHRLTKNVVHHIVTPFTDSSQYILTGL